MEKLDNIDEEDEKCPFDHTLMCQYTGTLFNKSLDLCKCCQMAQLIREIKLLRVTQS